MYPNINIQKVINFIVEEIFKEPHKYFSSSDEEEIENVENPTKIPPKSIFQKFLTDILLKFNCFSSVNGFYRQKSGASMGSRLSPILGNLYLHLMEREMVQKHIIIIIET